MQKITPFLWFNNQAEEAIEFYKSIFNDAKLGNVSRYGDAGPGPKGSVMVASFTLMGQDFIALNGGPQYQFTEAVSFVINCDDQAEVDRYWDALSEGGSKGRCGWLKDKFGLSWQVVPVGMSKLFSSPDRAKAGRAMQAMMQMDKLDLNVMQQAYDQP